MLLMKTQQDDLGLSICNLDSNLEDPSDKKFMPHRKIIKLRGKGIVDG